MREVNFSIPNVNKASVGITTALYDRRALDCTSTLPLIDSLNHLAYLTTSSARIRDILTVDGGIERLVCILKEGRSKDMMGIWKWNLAFQCVVNIGVRGTVDVRTRVVEADMVPVIATILDNYIRVIDHCREKSEDGKQRQGRHQHRTRGIPLKPVGEHNRTAESSSGGRATLTSATDTVATEAGPSVSTFTRATELAIPSTGLPNMIERQAANFPRRQPPSVADVRLNTGHNTRQQASLASANTILQTIDGTIRPVRDIERLASMTFGGANVASLPTSPTTPLPLPQVRPLAPRAIEEPDQAFQRRRPSIRHQDSTAESNDTNTDSLPSDEAPDADMTGTADIRTTVGIQDISMDDGDRILGEETIELAAPTVSETQDAGTFNITHGSPIDSSIANTTTPNQGPQIGLSPGRVPMTTTQPPTPNPTLPRYLLDRQLVPNAQMLAVMPREEDVLMSLQLLAYVSKYGGLRSYFQQSHLVPRLTIGKDLDTMDNDENSATADDDVDVDGEYLLPNDFNLFPLVEKFTVKYHNTDMQRYFSTDMQYWAGVVMRNLCRKDEERGGIRQCAYYQCGKWEEYTRQFAKCRRCRRTKYCSKECQKSAWAFHRHWCVATSQ